MTVRKWIGTCLPREPVPRRATCGSLRPFLLPPDHFKIGFPRGDIIEQRERFLDYAEERGAHVAGFLDPEGIGRVSRWENEWPGNQPEWAVICENL